MVRSLVDQANPIKYTGHQFANRTDFEAALGSDPRFSTCFFKGLIEVLFQSSNLSSLQMNTEALAHYIANQEEYGLKKALKNIFLSKGYSISRNDIKGSTATDINAPGFRVLNRHHLFSIASYLLQSRPAFSFPLNLNLNYQSISGDQIYLVHDNYFVALRNSALRISSAIVTKELTATSIASSRFVFRNLPDGYGLSQDDAIVSSQLISLWNLLTSENLTTTDEMYTRLKAIFDSAYNEETDANLKGQAGWQAILIAMMLTPNFFLL